MGYLMTTSDAKGSIPDWDLEQLEVILDTPVSWQLVTAGPGAGKSAVACQRISYLIDEGVSASRILLVSFTRTAVAELRDRIISYSAAGNKARGVGISTIDSHAWALRTGFETDPLKRIVTGSDSFELSISHTLELFQSKNLDLTDYMGRLEHLIVDEAQDVMGDRAELVLAMLGSLSPSCGVTILADPNQAIYGFTTDVDIGLAGHSLLERLHTNAPRPFVVRNLKNIHRIENPSLLDVFLGTRKEVDNSANIADYVDRIQQAIKESGQVETEITSFPQLANALNAQETGSTLVLFRRRADVLIASSYCSSAGVQHRLRMSDTPTVAKPWLGWLLGEYTLPFINKEAFIQLWEERQFLAAEPFVGESLDECWGALYRLAAAQRPNAIDLVFLRNLLSRNRPPVELCYPDLGTSGPILGTVHASKGREADNVLLVLPPTREFDGSQYPAPAVLEEGRVYYVGATRAKKKLAVAGFSGAAVGYLESKRVFRKAGEHRAQIEIGREGDVERMTHLAWSTVQVQQRVLAQSVGKTCDVKARTLPQENFATRLYLENKGADGISRIIEVGQVSRALQDDLWVVARKIDGQGRLRPAEMIPHLYLISVATVGVPETERTAVRPPYNHSAVALAPIIKGFPMVNFQFIRGRN